MKLGKAYGNLEIGIRLYEGLLPIIKLFVNTNLMSQQIPCDLQAVEKLLKT